MAIANSPHKRRISLQTLLIVLFVAQIAAVGGTTVWLSLRHGQRSVEDMSRALLGEVGSRIEENITAYLVVPHLLNGTNAGAYGLAGLDVGDAAQVDAWRSRLELYLWRQMHIFPQASYIAVANESGDCVSVVREQVAGRPAFFSETIVRSTGGLLERHALALTGRRAHLLKRSPYDPRGRPWYLAAKRVRGPVWSPVYTLFARQELGLTAAYPVYGSAGRLAGVLAADIELSFLSRFVAGLRIGKTGKAFVVERNGLLVAAPALEPLTGNEVGPSARLAAVDSADPPVRSAARLLASQSGGFQGIASVQQLSFTEAGATHLVLVKPVVLAEQPALDWLSVVVVNEDDFMGPIHANTVWTIGLCLLAMIAAAILGAFLTRRLTLPLLSLSAEMTHIANLELYADVPHPPSRVAEIDEIQTDLAVMKAGLRSFEKYVSGDVVRRLMRSQREASLGVESAQVTVFFSDIADFTTIAESMPLPDLVDVIGEYLGEMSNVIIFSGGTLDKFIGDAIMAFWNAPEPVDRHPQVACGVALRCIERLRELQAQWEARGLPRLQCRIGLHTGPVLVGNLGSTQRMDYTVIGDTVNLASRLEGLNKRYGTHILITEDMHAAVAGDFLCRPIDVVAVKGRSRPTRIFELMARRDQATPEQERRAQRYGDALDAYQARRFDDAATTLEQVLSANPDDLAARHLLARCREYRLAPPDHDWDGVLVLHDK